MEKSVKRAERLEDEMNIMKKEAVASSQAAKESSAQAAEMKKAMDAAIKNEELNVAQAMKAKVGNDFRDFHTEGQSAAWEKAAGKKKLGQGDG